MPNNIILECVRTFLFTYALCVQYFFNIHVVSSYTWYILPYQAHKVKRLGKICDECEDAHQFKIDFHRDHSPLDDGDTAYTGTRVCIYLRFHGIFHALLRGTAWLRIAFVANYLFFSMDWLWRPTRWHIYNISSTRLRMSNYLYICVGCLFCDDILSETGESAFGNLRKRRGKGRGRRGGRGGRGRKKMTKMDMLMAHNG